MPNRKLLMIEDDLDDRYITETYFAQLGHQVQIDFFDGSRDVVQYLSGLEQAQMPNLVILDPGKRGFETLQQLKMHPRFRSIPVVVVTELTPTARVKEAYSLGANSVIEKPSTHALTSEKISAFARYWLETVEL